jgi:hypothetical protein
MNSVTLIGPILLRALTQCRVSTNAVFRNIRNRLNMLSIPNNRQHPTILIVYNKSLMNQSYSADVDLSCNP